MRRCIAARCIEFDEGGRTFWVQGDKGTVLRIQLPPNAIISTTACEQPACSHADVTIDRLAPASRGEVMVCLGDDQYEE